MNHDGKLSTFSDDSVAAYAGMGGQGVLPIPLVYNGWVQNLPDFWKHQLTSDQRHPFRRLRMTTRMRIRISRIAG
jgi:hypothetical protein